MQDPAVIQPEVEAIDRELKIRDAQDHFLPFVELTMPDYREESILATRYEAAVHHKAICEALEQVEQGLIHRLIITMPPRHGKSELASRRFPPWFVGKDRLRQTIFATYSSEFGEDFGRTCRDIILSQEYREIFPDVAPKTETRSASRMEIQDGGLMVFTGVGGPVTGRGADLLIIDDPFKNRDEAESVTIREKRWDWFTSVAYTRLMPGGRIVIIMTRWHEDDIVGRLLSPDFMKKDMIKKWHRLDLPAIAHEGTDNEKALWPERYPLPVLKDIRDMIGPRDWHALYQQNPTPPEGAYFKRNMIIPYTYAMSELPKHLTKYTGFDLAVGIEKKNDSTVVLSAGLDEKDTLWILPEIIWEKRPPDQIIELIGEHLKTYQPMSASCEKGQLDKAVGPFLMKYLDKNQIYTYINKLPNVANNKGARATAIRGRMSMGKVRFPREAWWWTQALDQLLKFTGSGDDKDDDFVDALAMIGQGLQEQLYSAGPGPKKEKEAEIGTYGWVRQQADQEKRRRILMGVNDGW